MKFLNIVKACALLSILAAVTSAEAQAASQTANFAFAWTDNSNTVADSEDGFSIERRLGQTGTFGFVSTVGPNVVKYVDAILADPGNTQYCYRVRAYNKNGFSAFSNIACGTSPVISVTPGTPSGSTVTVTVTVVVP